jgi:hypothetical protein
VTKASDNPYPSLLLVEGAAPADPAAGGQRLFIDSTDHTLKRVDSAGTVTAVESGGGSPVFGTAQHAANITFAPSTGGTYQDLCTDADVTVAASVGDWLEVALATEIEAANNPTYLDVATRVSGATVNLVANGTNTAWRVLETTIPMPIGTAMLYQVVSGDISAGNVTLRMQATCDNTSPSRVVSYPRLTVKNLSTF